MSPGRTKRTPRQLLYGIFLFSLLLVCILVVYLAQGRNSTYTSYELLENKVKWTIRKPSTELILSTPACSNKTQIVLLVTSYAGDVEVRSAVRQAYPKQVLDEMNIRRVFLLARIHPDRNRNGISQAAIENEQERFQDMIQGDFIEDYKNLTLKHLMGLTWACWRCSHVPYIIKMDHDIVVDLFSIMKMLQKLPHRQYILAGYVMSNMKPIRERNSKWYVTREEYNADDYPSFLSGWLYITNAATVQLLYTASQNVPHFWIDDLYITGILAQEIPVPLVRLNRYYATDPNPIKCCISHPKYMCDLWVGPNGGDVKLVQHFAAYARACFKYSCKQPSHTACQPLPIQLNRE